MTDAEIKQALKDASLYLNDAAKAWPRYPQTALTRLNASWRVLRDSQVQYWVEKKVKES